MKVGQAIKLLKKAGFIETNQVGSHKKFQKVENSILIIYNMNKTEIFAEIVGHSLSPQEEELISVLCTFPRIILAELNTHRMLSKNTSSSRAIPFNKMVETIKNDPFIPMAWQKEHKGMQGSDYFQTENGENIHKLTEGWSQARDTAIQIAQGLNNSGVTKQLCNRLLEPFMWTTMLITGSREGWDNFHFLRNPIYEIDLDNLDNLKRFSSRKEVTEFLTTKEIDTSNWSEEKWLSINKGQAEIHMMMLSEKIYDAIQESVPIQLKPNEWHIPMISDLESLKLSTDDQIKLSVGRAANTSYTVVGDGKELSLDQAIKIHNKCKELNHSSVFEHCARAMTNEEYYSFIKGNFNQEIEIDVDGFIDISTHANNSNSFGYCRNFKGFIPYRYLVDNKLLSL